MAALLGILPGICTAQTAVPDAARIVALVRSSPQLLIDTSVPSRAFDPKLHPFVTVRSAHDGDFVGGFLMSDHARAGMLSNGWGAIAVPLESEGSGGIFTQLIFARTGDRPYAFAGAIGSGGHLDVRIAGGEIVATLPYYGPNDQNCCPSQRIVQTFTVSSGRLAKLSEKRFDIRRSE